MKTLHIDSYKVPAAYSVIISYMWGDGASLPPRTGGFISLFNEGNVLYVGI